MATAYAELPCGLAAPETALDHANGLGARAGVCGEPGIGFAYFACIHAHFSRVNVCGTCACELQRAAGLLTCLPCEDSAMPHECKPRVWIAWYDGTTPVTVVQERA